MAGGAPPLRRNASSALANRGAHTILLLFGGDLWTGGDVDDIWLAEFYGRQRSVPPDDRHDSPRSLT
jgi:hypothetical protein